MPSIHLDLAEFEPIIQQAVDRAFAKMRDEQPANDLGKLALGKQAAADALDVSVSTLDRHTYPRGDLRAVKLDGRVLYPVSELQRWIAERLATQEPTEGNP